MIKKRLFIYVVSIAAFVSTIGVLSGCCLTVKGENEKSHAEQLFEYRTAYVGDNAAVGNITGLLEFPSDVERGHIELKTDAEPYGIAVYLSVPPDYDETFDPTDSRVFGVDAAILFSLIKNADTVTFWMDDGTESPKELEFTREWAENTVGSDLWTESDSAEKLDMLIAKINKRLEACPAISAGQDLEKEEELEECIALAILKDNQSCYYAGECAGEGHIILGQEETPGTTVVYALTMYGEYGFQDNNFVKVSGSGMIPARFTLTASDSGFICKDVEYPEDGERYAKSIKKMFPKKYQSRALTPEHEDMQALTMQERLYAERYLEAIGREATVGDYGDFEHLLLTDAGVSVEVSNDIVCNPMFNEYTMWIGSREAIEDGVRYVYQQSYDKELHEVVFTKYEFDTNVVIEKIRVDALTGGIAEPMAQTGVSN